VAIRAAILMQKLLQLGSEIRRRRWAPRTTLVTVEARLSAGKVSKIVAPRARARLIVAQLHLPARIPENGLIRAERRRWRRAAKLLRCGLRRGEVDIEFLV